MAKKDVFDFGQSTKCWICDNVYVDGDAKVRDYYHILENIEALHVEVVISMLK